MISLPPASLPAAHEAGRAHPLIVEFAGLPGAGKTTIARRVVSALTSRGYRCGDRDLVRGRTIGQPNVPYVDLARFYLERPEVVRRVLALTLPDRRYPPRRLVETLKLLVWSYRLEIARRTPNDIVVLDQGVMQQAWSTVSRGELRSAEAVRGAVRSILQAAGVPFTLVYVDTDVDLAIARIQQRPTMRSTFDHMTAEVAAPRLALQQRGLMAVFQQAALDARASSVVLDGGWTPEDNCRRVVAAIEAAVPLPAAGRHHDQAS